MSYNFISRIVFKSFRVFVLASVIFLLLDRGMLWFAHRRIEYAKAHPINNILNPVKVFQIGFSKCGTVTIADFFNHNGVAAIHHDSNGKLPLSMYENYKQKKPIISPEYQQFYVYTDLDLLQHTPQISIGKQLFRELDKQYPGSKFILNTRNKTAWLKSRSLQKLPGSNDTLLQVSASINNVTEQEMLEQWSCEWDRHHAAVIEYFAGRDKDLLVFDIEKDSPQKLVDFFADNFKLDKKLYQARNKTTDSSGFLQTILAKIFK